METNQAKPKNTDEMDLTQFFRWIGRGFTRVGYSTLYGLAGLRNLFVTNRVFFVGIILAGLVLGALYSELLKKKFFKTSMVLSCDYLNTQILDNTIDKLNLLCEEQEREGLAELLKIDVATAKSIQKFEFKPFVSEDDVVEMEVLKTHLSAVAADKKNIVDQIIERLKIENKNAYEVGVAVYTPDIVKALEKALVDYFRSSNYIKRRIEINKVNLGSRKAKLLRESEKLDSLKQVLFENYQQMGKTSRGSNNVILGDERLTNPLDVFREDLLLNQSMLEIDRLLYIQPDFEVVEGFTTFKEPDSAGLVEILFIAFWISMAMGYLVIGAWKFDRMLANYPAK